MTALGHVRPNRLEDGHEQRGDEEEQHERPRRHPGPPPGLPLPAPGTPHRRTSRKGLAPAYRAESPKASSMRSSWLYFAVRSERAGAPVLICPAPVATARSAIVASSVSPERCEITVV